MFLSQFLIGRKSEASLSLSFSTTLPLWPLVWLECFSLKIGKRVRAFRLLCSFLRSARSALPLFQVEINLRIVAWIRLPFSLPPFLPRSLLSFPSTTDGNEVRLQFFVEARRRRQSGKVLELKERPFASRSGLKLKSWDPLTLGAPNYPPPSSTLSFPSEYLTGSNAFASKMQCLTFFIGTAILNWKRKT